MFITTNNGQISGCASYFHRASTNAINKMEAQNDKAKDMNIKVRYTVIEIDDSKADPKLIRD